LKPASGFSPDAARFVAPASIEGASSPRTARIALLGASGYSGQEFARLALGHEGITLAALVSRDSEGRNAGDILAGLDTRGLELPPVSGPAALSRLVSEGICDTIVSALPRGVWGAMVAADPDLAERPGLRIIDLSADFRDGVHGYLYGFPEAFRAELHGGLRIANPGCYPTAMAIALLPAAEAGWLSGPVMVTALSGVSGAGRGLALRTSFVEMDGGAALYKAGTEHTHVPEMERTLGRLAGAPVAVGFAPQLVPMSRGILLTATATLASPCSPEEVQAAYQARFSAEPFVKLLQPGVWPDTRLVKGSNRCDVAVTTLHGGSILLATAAIDNVVKGAAGQALQNLNLMLGWPETTGLTSHGRPW
jgi:N-acetyl-gamma-glutamyl-phosphate reductase